MRRIDEEHLPFPGRGGVQPRLQLFVAAEQLPRSQGHPFYKALNAMLAESGFDRWIEGRCQSFYKQVETRGQRSIPPSVYFRMLLVRYCEGIDSQHGITGLVEQKQNSTGKASNSVMMTGFGLVNSRASHNLSQFAPLPNRISLAF